MKNLKITLNSKDKDRNKDWYIGHAEAKNMKGNKISVDAELPKNLEKGLYLEIHTGILFQRLCKTF